MAFTQCVINTATIHAYTTPDGIAPADDLYFPVDSKLGLGSPPRISFPEYKEKEIEFTSIKGVGTSRMNDFGRVTLDIDIIVTRATTAGAVSTMNALKTSFAQLARFAVVAQGVAIGTKCKLVPGTGTEIGRRFIGGKCHLSFHFQFKSVE